MPSSASVDVRLLRGQPALKDDADILAWLDLHDRLACAPEGRITIAQSDFAHELRRPETTVRRFLTRLSEAGWIELRSERRSATIALAAPPCFIRPVAQASSSVQEAIAPPALPAKMHEEIAEELRAVFGAGPVKPRPTLPTMPAPAKAEPVKAKGRKAEAPMLPGIVAGPVAPLDFPVKEVPPQSAEAARFDALRAAFAAWVQESYGTPKRTTAIRWNHWLKRGWTPEQVEHAVEVVMQKGPAEPLAYVEGILRNGADEGGKRVFVPRPGARRPSTAKLVTTPEEMGVTDGLAEIARRNAEKSRLDINFV